MTQLAIINTAAVDISPVALTIPEGISLDVWADIGQQLGRAEHALGWWWGDWLVYGERAFPGNGEGAPSYQDAIAASGLDYGTLRIQKHIAGRFDVLRRRNTLSWSHHYEVASLPVDEQEYWLDQADFGRWNVKVLRDRIKGARRLPEPREAEPAPLLRYCIDMETAAIVAQILRVSFPDAATALDVTYGGGNFWDGTAGVEVVAHDLDEARALNGARDFRDLGYNDQTFDVGLFDPPHLADSGEGSIMGERFGTVPNAELPGLIMAGAREVWRVSKLGVVCKVTDHVHGPHFQPETDWVKQAIGEPVYEVVHQVRSEAIIDPKWNEQLSAYNNGATFLIFRRGDARHVQRGKA